MQSDLRRKFSAPTRVVSPGHPVAPNATPPPPRSTSSPPTPTRWKPLNRSSMTTTLTVSVATRSALKPRAAIHLCNQRNLPKSDASLATVPQRITQPNRSSLNSKKWAKKSAFRAIPHAPAQRSTLRRIGQKSNTASGQIVDNLLIFE